MLIAAKSKNVLLPGDGIKKFRNSFDIFIVLFFIGLFAYPFNIYPISEQFSIREGLKIESLTLIS